MHESMHDEQGRTDFCYAFCLVLRVFVVFLTSYLRSLYAKCTFGPGRPSPGGPLLPWTPCGPWGPYKKCQNSAHVKEAVYGQQMIITEKKTLHLQEDLVHLFHEARGDRADLGIQCHPAHFVVRQLNQTKPNQRNGENKHTDGQQKYLEDNSIYLWTRKSNSSFPLNSWRASWATFALWSHTR